ncbi:hypothetical protein IWQ60_004061 [Tieghemiomyces parasiticus]|uniref:SCP2 domain-containing protein n=1 Tax=Tieghemiomyces parasiticus TaxID=78921 RepID=A0A9W8AF04_9FUNG|nr:hypothetical protein IWQ60_004061 [Tieghemiomyces parasiticus]
MSLLDVPGFSASPVFSGMAAALAGAPAATRDGLVSKVGGVFQINVKNTGGKVQTWTLNLKKPATSDAAIVSLGAPVAPLKPSVIINVADADLVAMSEGKLQGQAAYMAGKLKIRGNIMLATKLDTLFQTVKKLAVTTPAPTKAAPNSPSPTTADELGAPGFQSSALFQQLRAGLTAQDAASRQKLIQGVRGVFQIDLRNAEGQRQSWVLNLKSPDVPVERLVTKGPAAAPVKADTILVLDDVDFGALGRGELNPQSAFMGGKLKIKGNLMLSMKLESVLKAVRPQAKL